MQVVLYNGCKTVVVVTVVVAVVSYLYIHICFTSDNVSDD